MFQIQEVYQCDLECAQQAESVTGELDELVTKIFEELMPVLKWSSWGLNDEVQPLDNIQRWYTDLIDTILEFYNLIMRGQEDVDINVNSPLRNQSPAILQKVYEFYSSITDKKNVVVEISITFATIFKSSSEL